MLLLPTFFHTDIYLANYNFKKLTIAIPLKTIYIS